MLIKKLNLSVTKKSLKVREGLGANRFQVFDVEKFATHTAKPHSPHNPKVPLQGDLGGLLEKFVKHT